jgi:hypothetical protein
MRNSCCGLIDTRRAHPGPEYGSAILAERSQCGKIKPINRLEQGGVPAGVAVATTCPQPLDRMCSSKPIADLAQRPTNPTNEKPLPAMTGAKGNSTRNRRRWVAATHRGIDAAGAPATATEALASASGQLSPNRAVQRGYGGDDIIPKEQSLETKCPAIRV